MNEIEMLIAGFVGGSIASSVMGMVFWAHIKWCYDEKFKSLQLQLIALRSEVSTGYVE